MTTCPNGELISAREKLVAMVLADSHQDRARRFTFPSVDTIAEEARCDRRSCQRFLAALERKGVIRRLRPSNQGAGMHTFYFFPALDEIPEGWQDAALFEFAHEKGRAAKGRVKGRQKGGTTPPLHNSTRAREVTVTETTEANTTPPTPSHGEGDVANSEFTPEQLAHLATVGDSAQRWKWEQAYREENQRSAGERAQQAANMAEEARLEQAMPTTEAARAWVMRECDFVEDGRRRGLGEIVQAAIELQAQRGEPAWKAARAIANGWKDYQAQGALIAPRSGPVKFIKTGMWRSRKSWSWNQAAMQRLRASQGMVN